MKKIFFIVLALSFLTPLCFAKTLNVVTTTEDLASLAREVGGDKVKVTAIARGYQNPHSVDAKPSYLIKLSRADLLVAVGLELEVGWLPPLIQRARNPKILKSSGYFDASTGCRILEVKRSVSRAEGDVHPMGNPHYWLDPDNGRIIARNLFKKLAALSPADRPYFETRLKDFEARLDTAVASWEKRMAPFQGTNIVTYHRSWPNFAKRFGLNVVDYVEPVPGIPPTASHILSLVQVIKAKQVAVILVEPYFNLKVPQSVAEKSGARVLVLLPSVGGEKDVDSYLKLFEHNISLLEKALSAEGSSP